LKLLRAGASVIATTRFVRDAARRFAQETDCQEWNSRLHIYGLDFRNLRELERWTDMISETYPRLDVIINNACQTIRRPPSFYSHLLPLECADEATALKQIGSDGLNFLHQHNQHVLKSTKLITDIPSSSSSSSSSSSVINDSIDISSVHTESDGIIHIPSTSHAMSIGETSSDPIVPGMSLPDMPGYNAATMSQIPILPSDKEGVQATSDTPSATPFTTGGGSLVKLKEGGEKVPLMNAFPEAKLDVNEQQVTWPHTRMPRTCVCVLHCVHWLSNQLLCVV
jgi:hypothetical protein